MRLAIERQPDDAWVVDRVGGIGRLAGATIEQIMRLREVDADAELSAAIAARRALPLGDGAKLAVDLDEERGIARLAPPPRPVGLFVPRCSGRQPARVPR